MQSPASFAGFHGFLNHQSEPVLHVVELAKVGGNACHLSVAVDGAAQRLLRLLHRLMGFRLSPFVG